MTQLSLAWLQGKPIQVGVHPLFSIADKTSALPSSICCVQGKAYQYLHEKHDIHI